MDRIDGCSKLPFKRRLLPCNPLIAEWSLLSRCRGLSNRGIRKEENGYLWPESEAELIEKSRKEWPEFYELYRRMHNAEAWPVSEVTECFRQIF
jgi:hypothetical protein